MLEARVKDLAQRSSGQEPEEARRLLLKSLGLYPLPQRTDLRAQVVGSIKRDGYRIEKLRYESQPGLLATAHLYLPDGSGPFPVVLSPHGHFQFKKSQPMIQARGISLALEGFATLIVDSPGVSWDRNPQNERLAIGEHNDWFLSLGVSIQGVYAWDLMRGLDYLETRADMDCSKVGITGASGGGTAALYTFAIDDRITCAVPVCFATSLEVNPHNGCLCNHVPGVLNCGDRTDILAIRAPKPVMLVGATIDEEYPPEGHQRAYEKLRAIYRGRKAESNVRLELIEGKHDYNRRMREVMVAFMREHLLGEPSRPFCPEKRPMTDGETNPYQVGTADVADPKLQVTTWYQRESKSFRDLLEESLREETTDPFEAHKRLVGWGRYGRIERVKTTDSVSLHDGGTPDPSPGSIGLPFQDLDQRLAIYLGLSLPEIIAQILHYTLPGGPEGWEASTLSGNPTDALTSMIASVKTLVGNAQTQIAPKKIIAVGAASSFTAMYIKLLRPDLEIETSHSLGGWQEALERNDRLLIQPGARYLRWPFNQAQKD